MKTLTFISKSLSNTKNIATQLANIIKGKEILLLNGEMGAGKTAFAKFFIASIAKISPDDVISPTFPVICNYPSKIGEIYHLDLYRIAEQEEFVELGIEELITHNTCLIEWASKLDKSLLNSIPYVTINITVDTNVTKNKSDESSMDSFKHNEDKIKTPNRIITITVPSSKIDIIKHLEKQENLVK